MYHFILCFSISLCFGISIYLPAQSVWQAEIPCGPGMCSSIKRNSLIKTSDGNYLVGLVSTTYGDNNQRRMHLYKYDQEGNLIWEKSYHFGATTPDLPHSAGPYVNSFIEDSNEDIICVGTVVDGSKSPSFQSYFFRANSNGDSLSLTIDSSYISFSKIIPLNNGEYFIPRVQKGYVRVDFSGEIIDEVNIDDFYGSSSTGVIVHNDNIFLGNLGDNPYFADSSRYQKYDLYTGEFLLQKKYLDIGDLLVLDSDEHIVAYSSGLMKMDTDFNPIWTRPFEDYDMTTIGFIQQGQNILKTADGGFILGGDINNGFFYGVYLIKTDNQGYVEWQVTQNGFSFGIEKICGLSQADDGGYVFLGGRDDGYYKLVKLNANGIYTNVNDEENSSSPIHVFPNPCQETLYLSSAEFQNGSIRIFDVFGNQIQQLQINTTTTEIDVQKLSSGVYYLECKNNNDSAQVIKFIKQ